MSRPAHQWNWIVVIFLAAAGCTGSSGASDGGSSEPDSGLCPPPLPGADGGADAGVGDAAATDAAQVPDGASCDRDTGLYWQARTVPADFTQDQAASACAGLILGNDIVWRLPTITELRSLVEQCDATQIGGDCQVEDPDCLTASICFDLTCVGCPASEGPGPNGCYFDLDGQIAGPCGNYWSSSIEDGFGAAAYYVLDYSDAKINRVSPTQAALARCVFQPPPLPDQP